MFYNSFVAMGTRFEAILPGMVTGSAESLFHEIRSEVSRIDEKFSHFNPESLVSQINREAYGRAFPVDEECWRLFRICAHYFKRTSGAFDITMAPLAQLWGFDRRVLRPENPPSDIQIKTELEKTGMRYLSLNSDNHSVNFHREGMQLNFASVGKGYALARVQEIVTRHGVKNALFSFGESSILGIGKHPYGNSWKISVQHPLFASDKMFEFSLNDESLSTSGTTRNFMLMGGKRYGHVINSRSGYPVCGLRSVSVRSPSALEAEILSTAMLAAGETEKPVIETNFPHCKITEYVSDD